MSRSISGRGRATAWDRSDAFSSIWLWVLILWLGAIFPQPSRAADKLAADLTAVSLRTRTAAPIAAELRFRWEGTQILEGHLEMDFYENTRLLGRCRTSDFSLTTGEQRFRTFLPPLPSPYSDSQVEVQMKFITLAGVFDVGPASVFMPTATERSMVLGWCSARLGGDPQIPGLEQTLLLEQFGPQTGDTMRRSLSTSIARFIAEDLPAQPLAYTSYDVVVLTAEAFANAREKQLTALARWVKGGGSVCVFVGGGLQPYHINFLNDLTESGPASGYLAGSDGNLLPGPAKISCQHSGVGRSVVVAGSLNPEPGIDSGEWRHAAAFLWKLRSNQIRAVAQNGRWDAPLRPAATEPTIGMQPYSRMAGRYQALNPNAFPGPQFIVQPDDIGPQLAADLMPRTVRLIPFSALTIVLALFLMMIGPVDYYVLGLLRRRRYTWILFPATSIGFTIVMVLMANHYLGQRDQRHALIIVDLDGDGSALRWNRYELVFAARDKQLVTHVRDALLAPLEFRGNFGGYYSGYPRRAPGGPENELPIYDGTLPVRYDVRQMVHQWRPELNRSFSFEPPPVPLPANWRVAAEAWPNLQQVRQRLGGKFTGDLFALTSTGVTRDGNSVDHFSEVTLERLSRAEPAGLFSVLSQISPTGGGNFEDAALMDTQSNDTLLAAVTKVGDDVVVYRRFFHGN